LKETLVFLDKRPVYSHVIWLTADYVINFKSVYEQDNA